MRSMLLAVAVALVVAVTCAPRAIAAFPYGSGGPEYRTGPGEVPNDIAGDDNEWKYSGSATVQDFDFSVPVNCVANGDPAPGSSCQISTTADTLVPGFAVEGRRSVVSAFSLTVLDTGADGQVAPANDPLALGCPPTCGSGDEKVFLRQGVFAP